MRSKEVKSGYEAYLHLSGQNLLESDVEPLKGTCDHRVWELLKEGGMNGIITA